MMLRNLCLLIFLGMGVLAGPFVSGEADTTTSTGAERRSRAVKTLLTADNLKIIASGLKDRCASAEEPAECHTAEEAHHYIVAGFKQYRIIHPAVQAAVVATMAYESDDFRYNKKHYPHRPDQWPGWGTKDMQSPENNQAYAEHLKIDPDLYSAGGIVDGNKLIDLVGADNTTFASAMWYIKHQCSRSFRQDLWQGIDGAFKRYVQSCLFADYDPQRTQKWHLASQVLIPTS